MVREKPSCRKGAFKGGVGTKTPQELQQGNNTAMLFGCGKLQKFRRRGSIASNWKKAINWKMAGTPGREDG